MTILHVIKNIWDSWLEVKRSTLITVWKKLIPTLMGESETFKDFSKESTCRCHRTINSEKKKKKRSRIRGGAGSYDRIAVISG